MGFWDWIKGAVRKVGNVVSAPFRAVGQGIIGGMKRLVGGLASAGERGGFKGVLQEVGKGVEDVAKKVSETPIIQATPLGILGSGITAGIGAGRAFEKGDVIGGGKGAKSAFDATKSLANLVSS